MRKNDDVTLISILREHLKEYVLDPWGYSILSFRWWVKEMGGYSIFTIRKENKAIGFIKIFHTKVHCSDDAKKWVNIDFHDPGAFEKLDSEIIKMASHARS